VGKQGGGEPRIKSHQPHLSLIYGTARWGPTSHVGLGVPDQDASQGPSWPLGQLVEINTNILPLDLILSFNLSQSLLSSFLILYLPTPLRISAYEHASSSRSIADRLNNYNTPLGSAIGTLTLGPLLSGNIGYTINPCRLCVFSVHTGW